MKKNILMLIASLLFGGMWFLGCNTEKVQGVSDETLQEGDENTRAASEESGDGILIGFDGVINYPKVGKYGLNILADDFVEAKKTEGGRYEYSVKADLTAGNSHLKIMMKPANDGEHPIWGGWNQGSDENWKISNVGSQFTCTVYESGKVADASVIFFDDCIIEFYENGATTPTKVKEIKVIQ
jgi:hypothetical protein